MIQSECVVLAQTFRALRAENVSVEDAAFSARADERLVAHRSYRASDTVRKIG